MQFRCSLSLAAVLAAWSCSLFAADVDEALARAVHERVFTIDTHDDIDLDFATSAYMPADHAEAQVTLDGMQQGGLDAARVIGYRVMSQACPKHHSRDEMMIAHIGSEDTRSSEQNHLHGRLAELEF